MGDGIDSTGDRGNIFKDFVDVFVHRRDLVFQKGYISLSISQGCKSEGTSDSKGLGFRKNIRIS
jgi:hypothetical protein